MNKLQERKLLDKYLLDCERRGLSPRTMWSRRHILAKVHNEVGLFHATPDTLGDWLDRDLKMSSKATYMATLRAFYEWCVDNDKMDANPVRKMSKLRVPKGEPHPITPEDLKKALVNAEPEMRAWLLLGAAGGLRCVEMAGLLVEDIHFEEPAWLHIRSGKGSKTRNIPLHPDLSQALKGLKMPSQGRVFPRVNAQIVSQRINRYLDSLEIDSTAHKLRHYAATTYWAALSDAGTPDIFLLTDFLGHSSPATSQIYTRRDQSKGIAAMRHFEIPS